MNPIILREPGSGTRELAKARLAELGLRPRRVMEPPGCEAVKRGVAAGLGMAFVLRRSVTLEIAHNLIYAPKIPALRFSHYLYALTRKEARPTAASLAFLAEKSVTKCAPRRMARTKIGRIPVAGGWV